MMLGLPTSGKEIEPLPKGAAARSLVLLNRSGQLRFGARPLMLVTRQRARWEEAAQETLTRWGHVPKRRSGRCHATLDKSETEDTGHFLQ